MVRFWIESRARGFVARPHARYEERRTFEAVTRASVLRNMKKGKAAGEVGTQGKSSRLVLHILS